MADKHITKTVFDSSVKIALVSAVIVVLISLAVFFLGSFFDFLAAVAPTFTSPRPVLEHWSGGDTVNIPFFWWFKTVIAIIFAAFINFLLNIFIFTVASLALSISTGMLVFMAAIRKCQIETSHPYEIITKDAHVRWPFRAESRNIINETYRKQFELVSGYLKNSPIYPVGIATGTMCARGDLAAPTSGQAVALDRDSLFQHLLVLGGTGEGKTTAILKPLMRQLLADKSFGMYVADAKGVLWQDALVVAEQVGRTRDVIVIGTGEGQKGVDLLAKLSPIQVSAILRSVLKQMGDSSDSFWPDMAANVLRNLLTIAQAYAQTKTGIEEFEDKGVNPYSLWWVYQAAINEDKVEKAIDAIREEIIEIRNEKLHDFDAGCADLDTRLRIFTRQDVEASTEYFCEVWLKMEKATKTGILANISQLLDGLAGAQVLRERFAYGDPSNSIKLAEALNGKIVLNALSTIEDGLAARLVSILLKTTLYREARIREAKMKSNGENPQAFPCVVMIDEVQEVVTADPASGLSDATFWNVARSTGLIGIFATQTIAALRQSLGKDAAENFLQQARSKIFFRSEDKDTIDYACWCAGTFERGRVYDDSQRESIEFREIIDGWTPCAPPDEDAVYVEGKNFFFAASASLVWPSFARIAGAKKQPTYPVDLRFVPPEYLSLSPNSEGISSSRLVAKLSATQAAVWRAEDLERKYRAEGNEARAALTAADVIGMGRWHAYAHIQRAGAVRQDIIRVSHDFE